MTSVQRAIKYCAIIFASILAVGIISVCAGAAIKVAAGIVIIEGVSDGVNNRETISFEKDFEAGDIRNLQISNYEARLTIQVGDAFHVEAINVEDDYIAEIRGNNTLYLGRKNENISRFWLFNWSWFGDNSPQVILTIPRDFSADNITLDTGSGSGGVNGLKAESMFVDSGSGRISLTGCDSRKLLIDGGSGSVTLDTVNSEATNIESGSGRLEVKNANLGKFGLESGSGSVNMNNVSMTDFTLNASSGRVALENGRISGDIRVDSGSGSVVLQAEADINDYEISCSTGSGGVWVNGEKKVDDYHYEPEGTIYELSIDGGSGRVSVDLSK